MTKQILLYHSQLEGSSCYITYDDVTLIATGLSAICPQTAGSDLSVAFQLPISGTGLTSAVAPSTQTAFQPDVAVNATIRKGSAITNITFATPLQCYADANNNIVFPFSYYFGHDGVKAAAAAI